MAKNLNDEFKEIERVNADLPPEERMSEDEIYNVLGSLVEKEDDLKEDLIGGGTEETDTDGGEKEADTEPKIAVGDDTPPSPQNSVKGSGRFKKHDSWEDFRADIKSYYDNNPEALKRKKERDKRKLAELQERKNAIKRFALKQTEINLTDALELADRRLMVAYLARVDTERFNKVCDYIKYRLTNMLRPLVPLKLRRCAAEFPQSVLRHQGFMYEPKGDPRAARWVVPDIPAYFIAGEEVKLLRAKYPNGLAKVDRFVTYARVLENRIATNSVENAIRIAKRSKITFLEVLKTNPFMFMYIYKEKTGIEPEDICFK